MSEADLTWTAGTVKRTTPKGQEVTLPAQRGLSADGFTAVELVGSKESILSATLIGVLHPTDEAVTRRNAAYAASLLQKAIPKWTDANAWLAKQMRELRRQPKVQTRIYGWTVSLSFLAKSNQLTLHITR